MSKKITGILLCMLMVITLAACGNSSGTAHPAGQTTDPSEVSSQEKESSSMALVLSKRAILRLSLK